MDFESELLLKNNPKENNITQDDRDDQIDFNDLPHMLNIKLSKKHYDYYVNDKSEPSMYLVFKNDFIQEHIKALQAIIYYVVNTEFILKVVCNNSADKIYYQKVNVEALYSNHHDLMDEFNIDLENGDLDDHHPVVELADTYKNDINKDNVLIYMVSASKKIYRKLKPTELLKFDELAPSFYI